MLEFWPRCLGLKIVNGSFTNQHLNLLKDQTRSLFDHGWNSYMRYGYPADEIMPLSCTPYARDSDVFNIHRNDVLGNYSVTLLDTITTFAIMGDVEKFTHYIDLIKKVDFNVDSTVQVFETSIRALGSLLSAHLYAFDKFKLPAYDGFLLRQAHDLGERLLPAYRHETGIPLARVNLRDGVEHLPHKLTRETCTAGAASPFLELTLLSVLTNDTRFEIHSKDAFFTLWNSRSKLDLLPMTINPTKGNWLDAITGIGASIDSFYEYALKGAILFNDNELMDVWHKSFRALSTHSKVEWFFGNVHVDTGLLVSPWIDALSAFFPGLLVLSGHVDDAKKSHIAFLKLWNQYQGIPERWDFLPTGPSKNFFGSGDRDPISLEWYPLRPEFVESTYYLYRATRDPLYLRVGERILQDYQNEFKVGCGFAGFRDVRTKQLQDRMESFVLSETFMYLYLLFDEENPLNRDSQTVFSTEGHPLWIPKSILNQYHCHKEIETQLDVVGSEIEEVISPETSTGSLLNALYEVVKGWSMEKLVNITKLPSMKPPFIHDAFEIPSASINRIYKKDSGTCEAPLLSPGLFSYSMEDPSIFLIDSKFHSQWSDKEGIIELSPSFYNIHVSQYAKCFREPTSQMLEFLVGDRNEIPNVHIETVSSLQENGEVAENLYLGSLIGLRMKIELLGSGMIDTFNNVIDDEFLNGYQTDVIYDKEGTCKPEDEIYANSVLRIKVINGILVKENSLILVSPESLRHLTIESITVTERGYIKIDNAIVINMMVLI